MGHTYVEDAYLLTKQPNLYLCLLYHDILFCKLFTLTIRSPFNMTTL